MPALLIRMSSTPNSASIHFAACLAEASSETSSWTNLASAPPARSSCSACRPRSASLAPASTVMPRAPSRLAVWRPMPLLAPVISTVVVMAPSSAGPGAGGRALPRLGLAVPPCARRDGAGIGQAGVMNRAELAAFLRTRRHRLRPADVGLPGGGRRRTPGLRRQEVAELAGISVDYSIRLEQARGPHPSRQVLTALCRALVLTADEREYLFRLADENPPPTAGPSREISPGIRNLLDSMPETPAYVVDAKYDVLAWNSLATHFIGDLSQFGADDRNMIRWVCRLPQTALPWTDP